MDTEELIELFHEAGKLKTLVRTGWERCGIEDPESVADHTFRTTFMAMILGDNFGLDTNKLMKMALIHDLAEVITGDITPYDDVPPKKKRQSESKAMERIFKKLSEEKDYLMLWREYDRQTTDEAVLLRNLDKFEMSMQAVEYESMHPEMDLSEFIDEVDDHLNNPEVRKLFDRLVNERQKKISEK